jgi:aarF domain-containing kinase
MKKTLMDQMDFINEADNLNTFNYMFKEREEIKFPFPFRNDTKETVLIETFVEGVPITHYENNPHELNSAMARIGARAFF